MTDEAKPLGMLPELAALTEEEAMALASLGEVCDYDPEDVVYAQDEPGGKLYVIESGSVSLGVTLADGVEKHHVTLPAESVFGSLAFIDGGLQPATARATEASRITGIEKAAFDAFGDDHPEAAAKICRYLLETTAAQSRLTIEKYLRTIEWNLEITAAAELNLRRLVEDRAVLSVDLVSGGTAEGTLLQFDSSPAGHELLLRAPGGEFLIVPYHAIAMLRLEGEAGDTVA